MIQTKLVGLIVISMLVGFPPAYAAATFTNASTTESLDPHVSSSQTSIVTSRSQPPATTAGVIQKNSAQDCDGEAPSSSSVTALISRLVRSSNTARGVQCPIPPVPDNMPIQEPSGTK